MQSWSPILETMPLGEFRTQEMKFHILSVYRKGTSTLIFQSISSKEKKSKAKKMKHQKYFRNPGKFNRSDADMNFIIEL